MPRSFSPMAGFSIRTLGVGIVVCALLIVLASFKFSFWLDITLRDSRFLRAGLHHCSIEFAAGAYDISGNRSGSYFKTTKFDCWIQLDRPSIQGIVDGEPFPQYEERIPTIRRGRMPFCLFMGSVPVWIPAFAILCLWLLRKAKARSQLRSGFEVIGR
jgi:hypothetical protein